MIQPEVGDRVVYAEIADGRGTRAEMARLGQRGTVVAVTRNQSNGNILSVRWDDPDLVEYPEDVPDWVVEPLSAVERLAELDK